MRNRQPCGGPSPSLSQMGRSWPMSASCWRGLSTGIGRHSWAGVQAVPPSGLALQAVPPSKSSLLGSILRVTDVGGRPLGRAVAQVEERHPRNSVQPLGEGLGELQDVRAHQVLQNPDRVVRRRAWEPVSGEAIPRVGVPRHAVTRGALAPRQCRAKS